MNDPDEPVLFAGLYTLNDVQAQAIESGKLCTREDATKILMAIDIRICDGYIQDSIRDDMAEAIDALDDDD